MVWGHDNMATEEALGSRGKLTVMVLHRGDSDRMLLGCRRGNTDGADPAVARACSCSDGGDGVGAGTGTVMTVVALAVASLRLLVTGLLEVWGRGGGRECHHALLPLLASGSPPRRGPPKHLLGYERSRSWQGCVAAGRLPQGRVLCALPPPPETSSPAAQGQELTHVQAQVSGLLPRSL